MKDKFSNMIFDLDGTLLDSIEGICYSINEATKYLYPYQTIEVNKLKTLMGYPIDSIIHLLYPEISKDKIKNIVAVFRDVYDRVGWQKAKLYDSVEGTLEYLKNNDIGLFVATNKPILASSKILENFRLTTLLMDIMTPDRIPNFVLSKKDMIEKLVTKYSLVKERTLMIGDSLSDARAAKDNDITFAFAAYGYGNKSDFGCGMIDYTMDFISDVLTINKEES